MARVYDDDLVEGTETFLIQLQSDITGGGPRRNNLQRSATISIIDNEAAGRVDLSITADRTTLRETDTPATITFTVAATGEATASEHVISVALSGNVSHGGGTTESVTIPAGARNTRRSDTFSVTIADETDADPRVVAAAEGTETLIATLGTLPTVSGLTFRANPNSVTVNVTDSPRRIALGGTDQSVGEGDAAAALVSIPIVVTGQATRFSTNAQFSITGTATPNTDYEVVTMVGFRTIVTNLVCNAGTNSCTGERGIFGQEYDNVDLRIRILDDRMLEGGSETLTIALTGYIGGGAGSVLEFDRATTRTITITETPSNVALGGTNQEVVEGETEVVNIPIVVTGQRRSYTTFAEFSITGSATPGTDYEVVTDPGPNPARTATCNATTCTGTIRLFSTQTSAEIRIRILDDGVQETASETLTIALTDHTGGGSEPTPLTFDATPTRTIGISDRDRFFTVSADDADTAEGDTATFTVGFAAGSTAPVPATPATVTWTLSGAAAEGADYTTSAGGASGVLTFSNDNDQTITATIAADNLNEGAEALTFTLSGASGGGGLGSGIATADASAVVTIAESDPIVITLSGGGRDNILNEDEFGSDPPVLRLDFGATLTRQLTVRFLLGHDSDPATNDVNSVNDGYDVGFNWLPASTPRYLVAQIGVPLFQFAAGASTGEVTLPLQDDAINEGEDVFVVVIDPDDQTSFSPQTSVSGHHGEVSVVNDFYPFIIGKSDPATVSIRAVSATVNEGLVAEFTVTLSNVTQGVITVPYTASGGVSGSTVFSAGFAATSPAQATISLPVPVDADRTSGTSEFTVTLGAPTADSAAGDVSLAAAPANSASVTVNHRAVAHTFAITGATSIAEGASATTYAINRTGPAITAGEDLVVSWSYAAGAPGPAAADFASGVAPAGGTATFTGSETSESFTIGAAADDNLNEPVENFVLSLSATPAELASEGGVTFGAPFVVGITDNDPTIVTIARDAGTPASVGEADSATFNISVSGGMRRVGDTSGINGFEVDFSLSGLERSRYSYSLLSDPTATSGFRRFSNAAGDDTRSSTIDLIDDELNEADRTFTFTGGSTRFLRAAGGEVRYATGADSASVMVTDDDLIAVGIARHADTPATVEEGGTAVFTVTLDHASAGAVTVNYAASGTTDAPTDADSGSIEIPAGETTGEIALTIPSSDALRAGTSETLTVTLNSASVTAAGKGPVTATGMATVTVNYIDADHVLAFSSPTTSIVEGASAIYTVTRTGPAITGGGNIVVRWTYAAGTTDPAAAADFAGGAAPVGGMLTFTGSETSETFTVATMEDAESEPDESFTLIFTADSAVLTSHGGVALPAALSVVIGASDQAVTLSVTAPGSALTEGTAADFAVSFPESVTTTAPVTVNWAISFPAGTDAAAAADFATGMMNGTASIAAGAMSVNVAITALADSLNEAEERFIVTLSAPAGGGAIAAPVLAAAPSADAAIAASDPITVTLLPPPDVDGSTMGIQVFEAADAVFTIMLSGPSQGDVTVNPAITIRAAATPADYTDPADVIVPAGTTSIPLRVSIAYDGMDETGEEIEVGVLSATSGTGAGMVTITLDATMRQHVISLVDVDALRTLSVAAPPAAANEGSDLVFTFTVAGTPVNTEFNVGWSLDSTSSAVATDYSGPATVTFAASTQGTQTQTLTLRAVDDMLNEDAETLVLTLTDPCGSPPCAVGGRPAGTSANVPTLQLDTAASMATGTIAASDPIAATLSGGGSVAEGGTATVAVALGATTTSAVTLTYDIGGTGVTAADFSGIANLLDNTVNIASDQSSASISLTLAADDNVNEADKDFTVTVAGGDFTGQFGTATVTGSPQTFTIADSDPITVSIARAAGAPATIEEGDTAAFTATLSVVSEGVVTVSYTASGTTDMPMDANGGSITIPAGAATGAIALTIPFSPTLGSSSPDQTLTVTLGAASVAAPGGGTVTASGSATVIVDYIDAAHRVGFSTSAATSIAEGAAATTYTISRTGPEISTGNDIVVRWTYAAGTTDPAAAADFMGGTVPAGGMLTFTGTETEKMFTVATQADTLNEAGETFDLGLAADPAVLTSNGGVALGDAVTVTIADDAADAIEVTIDRVGAANVGEAGTVNFSVTLSGGVRTADLIAPFEFSGLDNAEYEITMPTGIAADATGGTLTFPVSGTPMATDSLTVTANLVDDTLNEAAETLTVTGTAPGAAGLRTAGVVRYAAGGGDSATVTVDDDDDITVSVALATGAPTTVDEGATATFTFSLDVESAGVVTAAYTVANTTSGYVPVDSGGGSITFAAGEMSQDITLMMPFDQALGASTMDGTVTVTLGAASVAAPGGGTVTSTGMATVTVNYIDAAHALAFTSPTTSIVEGESATYTVTRTGPAIGGNIVVSWTYAAGTAAAADFAGGVAPTGGMLTFTGSETSQTFTIATMEDTVSEPDESFTLGLTATPAVLMSESGVSLPADLSVVIGESDQTVTLSVTAPGSALTEGTAANFRVSFPEAVTTTAPVAVSWRLDNLGAPGAAANEDFDAGNLLGNLEIAAGQSGADLPITALADSLNEAEESFTLLLLSASGGGAIAAPVLAGTPSASAAIAASDPVTVSVAAGTATVNEGGSATFTVTLSNASAAEVTVPWTVNELSDPDVIGVTAATLTFAAGATTLTQDIVVPIGSSATLDDGSPAQPLTVTLGTLAGGHGTLTGTGATATAMVSWVTAAHTVAFASPPMSITEGASATFVVTRTGPAITGIPIVVSWQVAADSTGSAEANDFTGGALPGGTVTFTGSQTMRSFVVATQDDNRSEMSETFTVGLSASSEVLNSNGGVAPGAATGAISITDNDIIRVSLTGPATVAENAPATYTVTLSAAPTVPVTMTWTVAAGAPSGDVIAAAAADFMGSVFPTGMLSFGVGVTSQSISFTTTAGAVISGSMDNTPNRAFTIALSNIMGGGGTMMPMAPPMPFAATIREDDPGARTMRMEQAATTLNRAAVALTVPVIARRFDPGRGLTSPGLALNLGGKQVLAPPGGVAASAGGGGGGAGGYAAIGLPNRDSANIPAPLPAIPAPLPVIPAKAGIQHTNSPAPAGLHQPDAGIGAVPAPVAGAVLAQTPGGALSAAPAAPPAADGQGAPSQTGPALLDMGALAELAAAQLEGLDSLSPNTESRTLQQLLGNSGFSATSDRGGGRTVSVWGRGSYTSLDGEPEEGGNRYDYDGDSYAFYLGLDGRYGQYLAGLAVGYSVSDLELRTVSGPAAGAAADRSDFESDLVAVYPYASWQPSDRLSVWVLTGYGQGELDIEERSGAGTRKATSDTDLWLGAAGLSLRRPTADGGPEVLLRLSGTVLHGETDGGRFDDNIAYAETETDAQQLRSEVELGQAFGFGDGGRLRPYLTAGVSYDFGDGSRDTITGEFGTGFQLQWPRLGLETEWEGEARLASKGDRNYREYTGTGTLRYDLGNDRRGLQLALRPAFGLTQGVALGGSDTAVMPLDGGAFGGASSSLGGASSSLTGGGAGGGAGGGLGLHGELSYGIGNVRALGLPGLLTLYGAGGLSAGSSGDLYRGGVRFEAARFTLGAGLQHESGGDDSDSEFLLDGAFRF